MGKFLFKEERLTHTCLDDEVKSGLEGLEEFDKQENKTNVYECENLHYQRERGKCEQCGMSTVVVNVICKSIQYCCMQCMEADLWVDEYYGI